MGRVLVTQFLSASASLPIARIAEFAGFCVKKASTGEVFLNAVTKVIEKTKRKASIREISVAGFLKKGGGFGEVFFDTSTEFVEQAEVEAGTGALGVAGFLKEGGSVGEVIFKTRALRVEAAEHVADSWASIGRAVCSEEREGTWEVFWDTATVFVENAEVKAGERQINIAGCLEVFGSFGKVLGNVLAFIVEESKPVTGFWLVSVAGFLKEGHGFSEVFITISP